MRSIAPQVRLENAFARPYENAIATARTCYSSAGILTAADVSGDALADPGRRRKRAEQRDRIARSIYEAGHHTTLQHAHFQFALSNVSRHCIWSFLHSHPFYNSEQVSQRYVRVDPSQVAVPDMPDRALPLYQDLIQAQAREYETLIAVLRPQARAAFHERFLPSPSQQAAHERAIDKKAQEVARYVLPVATLAYLYHTVSALTLLRYHRLCDFYDVPGETRLLVTAMVDAVLAHDPLFAQLLEEEIALEATPEAALMERFHGDRPASATRAFCAEFDASLEGRVSRLVDRKTDNEGTIAAAAREVLGLARAELHDDEAIALLLDPARNAYLGHSLNVGTLSKLLRCLVHAHYTFRKKLSHTADSQDQRHRMTPASRPILVGHLHDRPDVVVPELIRRSPEALERCEALMERTWRTLAQLRDAGASAEAASYALPNAVAVRFTESADLLHLHHKLTTRLCYNAQEEIWRACLDEAEQIRAVEPRIGAHLLPPCGLRKAARMKPVCPEGDRYCGIPVWKLDLSEYQRAI
jgi:thymidylate synthase ThyX